MVQKKIIMFLYILIVVFSFSGINNLQNKAEGSKTMFATYITMTELDPNFDSAGDCQTHWYMEYQYKRLFGNYWDIFYTSDYQYDDTGMEKTFIISTTTQAQVYPNTNSVTSYAYGATIKVRMVTVFYPSELLGVCLSETTEPSNWIYDNNGENERTFSFEGGRQVTVDWSITWT